jgi:cell wall-associated NlpC family hydrolase
LHRSILTGLFACILTLGVTTPAWAEAPSDLNAPAAAPATVPSAAAASAAAPTTTEALPTDGADFAMWNVEPPKPQVAPHPKGSRLARLLHVQRFASGIAARGAAMASVLTRNALRFLGVPYAFGGTSTGGFDCSGYVQHVFAMIGLRLPRTADAQFYATQTVSGGPLPGDLVFSRRTRPVRRTSASRWAVTASSTPRRAAASPSRACTKATGRRAISAPGESPNKGTAGASDAVGSEGFSQALSPSLLPSAERHGAGKARRRREPTTPRGGA